MFKKIIGIDGTVRNDAIIRLLDSAVIPFDEANTDYQEYLQFLADGGVPEPADE